MSPRFTRSYSLLVINGRPFAEGESRGERTLFCDSVARAPTHAFSRSIPQSQRGKGQALRRWLPRHVAPTKNDSLPGCGTHAPEYSTRVDKQERHPCARRNFDYMPIQIRANVRARPTPSTCNRRVLSRIRRLSKRAPRRRTGERSSALISAIDKRPNAGLFIATLPSVAKARLVRARAGAGK